MLDENIINLMKMNGDIEAFIETYVNSFVKWEVVQFYYDHPNKWFELDALAATLNRPVKILKKEMQELHDLGFLQQEKKGKTLSYRFLLAQTPEGKILEQILERFITICQDREGRLRVVYKLLKNGKPISG
ncbi:hypothetical protein KAR34_14070 [bacterium]|nr:hypothetical protein [bacterium]